MNIQEIQSVVGLLCAIIGVLMVYHTLKCNHDWNRRKYTLDIVREWNTNVMTHAIEIERILPHLFDIDKKCDSIVELTLKEAKEIYLSKSDEKEYTLVRHSLHCILNQFEFLATAYIQNVADKTIVETSFGKQLIRLHDILLNYLKIVEEHRGYQPWQPYIDLVVKWKSEKTFINIRVPTA
jgi:hypothetical protein